MTKARNLHSYISPILLPLVAAVGICFCLTGLGRRLHARADELAASTSLVGATRLLGRSSQSLIEIATGDWRPGEAVSFNAVISPVPDDGDGPPPALRGNWATVASALRSAGDGRGY